MTMTTPESSWIHPNDRRLGRRFGCDLGLKVASSENVSAQGRVLDISSIGARMEFTPEDIPLEAARTESFPPGANISISMTPFGKAPIALEARIVWRKQRLFGVAFVDVPEESRSRLWNLLIDAARNEWSAGRNWLRPDDDSDKPINAD
jgi:hypothetical protein